MLELIHGISGPVIENLQENSFCCKPFNFFFFFFFFFTDLLCQLQVHFGTSVPRYEQSYFDCQRGQWWTLDSIGSRCEAKVRVHPQFKPWLWLCSYSVHHKMAVSVLFRSTGHYVSKVEVMISWYMDSQASAICYSPAYICVAFNMFNPDLF